METVYEEDEDLEFFEEFHRLAMLLSSESEDELKLENDTFQVRDEIQRTVDPNRESGLGSDSDNMAELAALLNTEIPEGQNSLSDSHTNLERVAEYCEGNYFQSENKRIALEETKNYTTQSSASVAYQINTLAYNFLQLLDLQTSQLAEMESQMNHIAQTVMIHKEKVARREIGVLTANKTTNRQYKIIAPVNPEKPIKYVRKSIDYNVRDITRFINHKAPRNNKMFSHYAPNYPLGHPRRTGVGYSTLPMASTAAPAPSPPPQVGMVHPLPQTPPPPPPPNSYNTLDHHASMPPPPSPLTLSNNSGVPASTVSSIDSESMDHNRPIHSTSTLPHSGVHHTSSHHHHHTLPHHHSSRSSPPLPPPPLPEEDQHPRFGQPASSSRGLAIVSDEPDLPGWVPKNYIEKVVAIYDYYADKEDEVSFQESAVIYVLKKNDDGWWEGVMDGITGLFPGNYVEPCV
ncbi:abl interactor 2-like [Lycorma delicatula]|uniref:abl interactor 2-like n=1 Tax=Lycorma delicatula TaxID=130591 RepID=UPI003F51A143